MHTNSECLPILLCICKIAKVKFHELVVTALEKITQCSQVEYHHFLSFVYSRWDDKVVCHLEIKETFECLSHKLSYRVTRKCQDTAVLVMFLNFEIIC